MSLKKRAMVAAGRALRFPSPYWVNEYLYRWSFCLHACRFAILLAGSIFTVLDVKDECETGYAGWRRSYKHWGCRRDVDDCIRESFMDIPFV